MARNHKTYSEEIILEIYRKLSEGKFRFDDLHEATGRNRVTLSEYLTHGQEVQEVQRDPRTKEYELTDKGKEELDRLLFARTMREACFHYKAIIQPESKYFPPRKELFYDLPLPAGVEVSLYGSEKLVFLSDSEEESLRDLKIPDKHIQQALVSEQLRDNAEEILWKFITRRLWMLLDWHDNYEHSLPMRASQGKVYRSTEWRDFNVRKKPPPLTIENILGFDLAVTFRFPGKLLEPPTDGLPRKTWIKAKREMEKRFVGTLLLRIASDNEMDCECGIFEHFEKAGLMKKDEADEMTKLQEAALVPTEKPGHYTTDRQKHRIFLHRVYEIACQYLAEGGVTLSDR